MEMNKITAAVWYDLQIIDKDDEPFTFISVFVHLLEDFSESGDSSVCIKNMHKCDEVDSVRVYTDRLVGMRATKNAIEQLSEKEWVHVIKLMDAGFPIANSREMRSFGSMHHQL